MHTALLQSSLRRAPRLATLRPLLTRPSPSAARLFSTVRPEIPIEPGTVNASLDVHQPSRLNERSGPTGLEVGGQMLFGVGETVGGEHGSFVKIVEVGPRDGLQYEKVVPKDDRAKLIRGLMTAGCKVIESGSIVHHQWVPQMEGSANVLTKIANLNPDIHLPMHIPNMKGFINLLKEIQWDNYEQTEWVNGEIICDEITVTLSCTESFSIANENVAIRPHIESLRDIVTLAVSYGFRVRAHLAVAIECPFEGPVPATRVADLAEEMLEMGCYEVALADTTGRGDPASVRRLIETVGTRVGVQRLSGHFHDTFGTGLSNVLTALSLGVRTFDTAVAGLGTCPYSPGQVGNIATEDVVYTLHNLGYHTGINIVELAKVGGWISERIPRENSSRAGKAILSRIAWEERAEVKQLKADNWEFWRDYVVKKRLGVLALIVLAVGALTAYKAQTVMTHPHVLEAGFKKQNAQDLINDAMRDLEGESDEQSRKRDI